MKPLLKKVHQMSDEVSLSEKQIPSHRLCVLR